MRPGDPDVIVLGAGPNGLTAAAFLARAGLRVLVLEEQAEIGGAVRTAQLTLPGYLHDRFSGFYPLASVGPIARLPLEQYGLGWTNFARPYGGGVPSGPGVVIERTERETRQALARSNPEDLAGWDELTASWRRIGGPFLRFLFEPLGSISPLAQVGIRLLASGRLFDLGQTMLSPASFLARRFGSDDARVFFIGGALHSDLTPDAVGSGLYSLILLGLANDYGMPIPRGGAQAIPDALRALIGDHGGAIRTGARAERIIVRNGRAVGVATPSEEILARRGVLATVEPQQLFLRMVEEGALPDRFLRAVRRFEWGTGAFKLDAALSDLPTFAADRLNGVGVLHLGRSADALSAAACEASSGLLPAHPLLIVGFHTLADPSRAPSGGHTLWLETHVPPRIRGDARGEIAATDWQEARAPFAERLLDELDAYAPGVRSSIRAYHAQSPDDLHAGEANLVGGDISGGTFGLHQQMVFRPVAGWFRHRTPIHRLYLGGASTHPGGGVHGASGANAARILLGDLGLARRFPGR